MVPVSELFKDKIAEMVKNSKQSQIITPENVYQEANMQNRPTIDEALEKLLLKGSRIINSEALEKLYDLSQEGKSCLILMEHYSNFDLPILHYLLKKEGKKGEKAADSIIAMAGMKLNETNKFVSAFTEAYSRIVIFPSRSLASVAKDSPEKLKEAEKRSRTINRAALHSMIRAKHDGNIILVFPSGTRYRPWEPETKKGLREIDSYIKSFDHMVLIGINGNALRINPKGAMNEDLVEKDQVILTASEIIDCGSFREKAREACPEGYDPKQYTVDSVMEKLDKIHEETEKIRQSELKANR
ncbi:MAG: 1-acyl-sn-glycerol-3-phosphate acyltransferase [Spirochaetia bacterium]